MPKSNLDKLSRFLEVIDSETLTKQDFEQAFNRVIDIVQQILQKQNEFEQRLSGGNQQFQTVTKSELNKALSDLKSQTNDLFVGQRISEMSTEQKKLFNSLKKEANDIFEKRMSEMHKEIERRAVKGERGVPGKGLLPTREQIVAIVAPELDKFKEEVETKTKQDRSRGNAIMRKVPVIKRINLTNQVNGEAKEFKLPKDTVEVLGVWGTMFPITFDTADFSLVGNTLVLTDEVPAPESGQTLFALCEVLFY